MGTLSYEYTANWLPFTRRMLPEGQAVEKKKNMEVVVTYVCMHALMHRECWLVENSVLFLAVHGVVYCAARCGIKFRVYI